MFWPRVQGISLSRKANQRERAFHRERHVGETSLWWSRGDAASEGSPSGVAWYREEMGGKEDDCQPVELGRNELVVNTNARHDGDDGPRHADDVDDGEQELWWLAQPALIDHIVSRGNPAYAPSNLRGSFLHSHF